MAASWSRWTPSGLQITILESNYQQNPYPDGELRLALAQQLGIEARQVQVWFQNRRQKAKKASLLAAQKGEGEGVAGADDGGEGPDSFTRPASSRASDRQPSSPQGLKGAEKADEKPSSPGSPHGEAGHHHQQQPHEALPATLPMASGLPSIANLFNSSLSPALGATPSVNELLRTAIAQHPVDRTVGLALQQARQLMMPMLSQQMGARAAMPPPPAPGSESRSSFPLGLGHLFNMGPPPPRFGGGGPMKTISKPQPKMPSLLKGIPMSRRAISMDALEVLSNGFDRH